MGACLPLSSRPLEKQGAGRVQGPCKGGACSSLTLGRQECHHTLGKAPSLLPWTPRGPFTFLHPSAPLHNPQLLWLRAPASTPLDAVPPCTLLDHLCAAQTLSYLL